ncbi:hypothetical protein ACQ4LE_005995 [Meloidogyne hapla]|uniref:Mitochondrial glyco protein n=1 Tax=Meloidogyne hapla TaxID=6305 RepID=A0A1I8BIQ2_MELHA
MFRLGLASLQRISTRGIFITSVKSSALANLQQSVVKRAFSTSQTRFSSVAKELQDVLHDEIKAEKSMEEEHLGGKTPPSVTGFEIGMNDAEFRLTKTYGNEKILVSCNVNHSVENEDDDDDDYRRPGDDMENENAPVSLPPFRIEITKGDLRLVFLCQMVKDIDGGFDYSVDEFMIAPATKSDNKYVEVPDEVYSSSGQYIDQQLHELLFVRYLEERGLGSQFCHDFVKLATHYEHQQYVNLLEKLKNFVGQ